MYSVINVTLTIYEEDVGNDKEPRIQRLRNYLNCYGDPPRKTLLTSAPVNPAESGLAIPNQSNHSPLLAGR